MLMFDPRSTSSHCGSLAADDQRVPVLPSTAAEAGVPAFSIDDAVAVLLSATLVVPQPAGVPVGVPVGVAVAVAVGGGPDRAVHAHVATGARDGQSLDTAGAGGRGVDVGPVRGVGRSLDLEALARRDLDRKS